MPCQASILGGEELERLLAAYECGNEGLAAEARANAANVLDLNFMQPLFGWKFFQARREGMFCSDRKSYDMVYTSSSFCRELAEAKGQKWPVLSKPCVLVDGEPVLCVSQWLTSTSPREVQFRGVVLVHSDGTRTVETWSHSIYSCDGSYSGFKSFASSAAILPRDRTRGFISKLNAAVGSKWALKTKDSTCWIAYSSVYGRELAPVPFAVMDPFGASWFDTKEQAEKFASLTYRFPEAASFLDIDEKRKSKGEEAVSVELEPVQLRDAKRIERKSAQ